MLFKVLVLLSICPRVLGETPQSRSFKKCYDHLGCVVTTNEWYDDKLRPKNFKPLERHTIHTEFLLITKKCDSCSTLLYDIINLKPETVKISTYQKDRLLYMLIHDFTSNGFTGWIKHISDVLLMENHTPNIISVDWEAGAEPPFNQAIANARVVALEIVAMIRMFKADFGLTQKQIHLIGHGVGAHIAGYVGNATPVGYITGLDPTGPHFEGMPTFVRLDCSDADFVEVLHTDAFHGRSQGMRQPTGHADFYINNAELQPKCEESTIYPKLNDITRNSIEEDKIYPGCSHKRAFKYYIESFENKQCTFVGFKCGNYDDFITGKCASCEADNSCSTFGGGNECGGGNVTGMFYLHTGGEKFFCLHPYKAVFKIESDDPKRSTFQGSFEIILVSELGELTNGSFSEERGKVHLFHSGELYTMVFYFPPPKIMEIKEARIKWVHHHTAVCKIKCLSVITLRQISITAIQINPKQLPETVLVAENHGVLKHNDYVTFTKKNNSKRSLSLSSIFNID